MKTSPSFARRTKPSTAFCGPGWMCWSSARAWSREAEPVRLFFINRFFHPDQSATAQMLTDLAEGLAVPGTAVTVLTGRLGYLGGETAVPCEEQYKGVTVRRVWSTRFGRQSALGRLFDYLSFYLASVWAAAQTKDVDCVVVLSDPPILSVQAVLLGRLKGWKTVCWLQDVFPEIAVRAGTLREGFRARLLRWAANWSLRKSDRVIVVGRCMEQYVLAFGLQRDRVVLIPNWADGDELTPVAPEANWFRKQHGLEGLSVPSKVYGIMAVGRPVVFIGPDKSEVASLIRESGCGEVFFPQESEKAALAILHLAQDDRRRESLGSAGRRYFETFLDKRYAIQRFRAVLQDMMAET